MCSVQEACGSWRAPGEGKKACKPLSYDSEGVFWLPHVKHKLMHFLHLRFSHCSFRFSKYPGWTSVQQFPTWTYRFALLKFFLRVAEMWFLTIHKINDYSLESSMWTVKTVELSKLVFQSCFDHGWKLIIKRVGPFRLKKNPHTSKCWLVKTIRANGSERACDHGFSEFRIWH